MINKLRWLIGRRKASPAGLAASDPADGGSALRPLEDVEAARDDVVQGAPAFVEERGSVDASLAAAFTPTRPRSLGPLFIGRETHLRRMIAAVEQERAHIILFGERGRGKTSLANGFAMLAQKAGFVTVRRACGVHTTYERLFRGLLAELPGRMVRDAGPLVASAADLLPEGDFGADEVCDILARLRGRRVVLVVDEFDRAESDQLRSELAETIKNLSDQTADATLLLVGVAGSLEDLLGRQPSIQRAILAIPLPPMDCTELATLVAAGARAAGLSFEPAAVALIVLLSRGMPYYAHLLSLYAARSSTARGSSMSVTCDDALSGVEQVMQKHAAEMGDAWTSAMSVLGGEPALLAAALAPFDGEGRVALSALPVKYHPAIDALCTEAGGAVLVRRDSPTGPRIGFQLPIIAHQVLLRAARAGSLRYRGHTAAPKGGAPHGDRSRATIAA